MSMDEEEEKLRVARRIKLIKRILIPLLLLSILGTYLVLRYSYLLATAPPPLQLYSDPVLLTFLFWSFDGLMLLLLAYYSRLQRLLRTRQVILLGFIFIIFPILSYVYLAGLWLLQRPHEAAEDKSREDNGPGSLVNEKP